MDEQKNFTSSLPSRIWKIGSLTTGVSKNIITNKIKEKFFPKNNGEESEPVINSQIAEKIVKVLGELKGPWMKIGQYISLHDTYSEDDFFQAFSTLQYESPSMSYYFTRMQIEKELGKSPDLIYRSFSRKPIGAASIGQVHEAVLKTGEKVAVKVQYPDMERIIKSDLTTLKISLTPLKVFLKGKLEPVIEEIEEILLKELDYSIEANNMRKFKNFLSFNPGIIIPEYYDEFSTPKVLTMKFIDGIPLEQSIKEENLSNEERNELGKILLHSLWNQLFIFKTIHADPHPGNFLVVDKCKIALLDFGCIKTFEGDFVSVYRKLIRAIIQNHSEIVRDCYIKLGFVSEEETEKLDALEEFSDFVSLPFTSKDFFDLNENMHKLKEGHQKFKEVSDRVGFRIPKDFIYLNRTLFGIGMILFKLRVNLNFFDEIESYLFGD